MGALFSDPSSWQTPYPGVCNVTTLESDMSTYTVYEASVENWPGMYCNDITAHTHKAPLTEEPTCTFSHAFLCFMTGHIQKHQHTCAVISEPVNSVWTGSHIRISFARYVSYSTACIMQDSAAMQEIKP